MTSTSGAHPPMAPRAQVLLAVGLAMIAGCVDAYAFIRYQTYVSFMSGNTTQSGAALGQANFALAAPALLAIAAFLAGVFVGTLLSAAPRLQPRWLRFALVATLLAAIMAVTHGGLLRSGAYIAALGFAMGVMNTCLSRIGSEAVSLTFVTGALNRIGTHAALALLRAPLPDAEYATDSHLRRAGRLAALWLAFLLGAFAAGTATPRCGEWVLLPPLLLLVGLALGSRKR